MDDELEKMASTVPLSAWRNLFQDWSKMSLKPDIALCSDFYVLAIGEWHALTAKFPVAPEICFYGNSYTAQKIEYIIAADEQKVIRNTGIFGPKGNVKMFV